METAQFAYAKSLLKRHFGYDNFRPQQWEVISHVMAGNDALVLMPTGGGKSLCYQIPGIMGMEQGRGCTLVVSPLLALMFDQVRALPDEINARVLNSECSEADNRATMELMLQGKVSLLYISPEKLVAEIDNWSSRIKVNLIAIDEAHCISQWGHDFRPEYTQLSVLKRYYPHVPIMALTATADRLTRRDIVKQLCIQNAGMFIASFDRPNIHLSVERCKTGADKLKRIVSFIADEHPRDSGIVYCMRRRDAEEMAKTLQSYGIDAGAFHAGIPAGEKHQIQRDFVNDDLRVVCATIAFGMGIDKSNVRFVIHYNMPKSIENYYQEIGRAGRDGAPADALMLYSYSDVKALTSFAESSGQAGVNMDKLRRMQEYAEGYTCRRQTLINYFNEPFDHECGNCDVCDGTVAQERIDGTLLAQKAMSAIARTEQKADASMVVKILTGSRQADVIAAGYDRLPTYGKGNEAGYWEWRDYLLQMLHQGLIEVSYENSNHLHITAMGWDVLRGKRGVCLSKHQERSSVAKKPSARASREKPQPSASPLPSPQEDVDQELFDRLRDMRKAIAKASGVPPYVVFHDTTLREMAAKKPVTKEAFAQLSGVGESKCEKYWRSFVSVVQQHQASH